MTPFLRTVLCADSVLSTLTMLPLVADANPLSTWLGVSAATLQVAGIALLAVHSVGTLVLAEFEWIGLRRACARAGLN